MKDSLILIGAVALSVTVIVAVGILSYSARISPPPCYDLAGGGRICIQAEPIPAEKFFTPPAKSGTVAFCTLNTAGLLSCK